MQETFLISTKHKKVSIVLVPETRNPYDSLWHELSSSSPYNDNIENISETTAVNEPFFDEPSSLVNVSAQLGSDVILHCRVNDLREKMVSFNKRASEKVPINQNKFLCL